MNQTLDSPMPKPKKAEGPEETVVKIEKELVDLIKQVVLARNSRMKPGEKKLTIAKYISDTIRKPLVDDYNAELKRVKPKRLEDFK